MKKQLITGIIIIAILLMLSKSNFKGKMVVKTFTLKDGENAIKYIAQKYGVEMARIVEKILRAETKHFTSGQYIRTGSAGMEVGKWKNLPKDKIAGTIQMNDADTSDGIDTFYVWNSVTDFADYLAQYIQRHKGNYARWNSTNEKQQIAYRQLIDSVRARFI